MSTINGSEPATRQATARRVGGGAPAGERLRKQAKKVTKDVQDLGGIATDAAQEKLDQLRDDASDYYEQGRDKVNGAQHSVEQFIQDQPVKSILIAAGVGLVLGRFWLRR